VLHATPGTTPANLQRNKKEHSPYSVEECTKTHTVSLQERKLMKFVCTIPEESGSVVVKALCYEPEGRWFAPDDVSEF
jgi:hypothetical protein